MRRIARDRLRHTPRQWTVSRVRQEDLVPDNWELVSSQLFVGEQVSQNHVRNLTALASSAIFRAASARQASKSETYSLPAVVSYKVALVALATLLTPENPAAKRGARDTY
ncbi:hypothetical protein SBV1_3170018 [Verrucomicrobia bacterium]|nr:hypothetical protein SBV1_3170018 [Verrucomicrobiota bacterium]